MPPNKQPDGSYVLVMPLGNAKVSLLLFTSPRACRTYQRLGAVGMAGVWVVMCSLVLEPACALDSMILRHPLSECMPCRRHGAPRLTLATWQQQSSLRGPRNLVTRR